MTAAQRATDQELRRIHLDTLEWQSAELAARAPIHQLFHHHLVGGRLERFLGNNDTIALPGDDFPLVDVRNAQWTVNGQCYDETLNDVVARAIAALDPAQAGPSIVGHGDAHNGNVFFQEEEGKLIYFDPAFAGRHDPLLDLTKPLFHNVFAMWMYFPYVKQRETTVAMQREGDRFYVDYDYRLHPVRMMFLRSKVDHALIPLLREFDRRGWLRSDWRHYLKAALFCCPLLTMNLADPAKFPPEISLLGLATALEMGAESRGRRSLIDRALDEAESALRR